MSQCENCDNCENCDDQTSADAAEPSVSLRRVFLLEAPEGAYSEEFRQHCLSVWPEDQGEELPLRSALKILKYLLETEGVGISDQAGLILDMMFSVTFSNVEPDEFKIVAAEEGMDYNPDTSEISLTNAG